MGDDERKVSRRRFLLAGAAVAGVAGCTGDGGGGGATATTANVSLVDTETPADADTTTGGDGEATTTGDGDGTGDGGATTTGDGGTTADGGTEETTAATGETGETTTGGGTTAGGGVGDNAPMYQYDAANTGYNPSAAGPTSSATPAWSVETGDYLFDTPSVVGGNVYVGSADGTLYALDRGGNERWTYDAPAAVKRTAVGEGAVYLAYGDEKAGFAAVSTDGEELWTAVADDGAVGAPTVHDGTVYVTEYSGVVRAIDAASGKEQWRADTGTETPATPSVADGTVYLGVALAVQAYDAATGERRWTFEVSGDGNFTTPAPAVADGAVFFGDFRGNVYAVEADGTERWSHQPGSYTQSSPAAADDLVYLAVSSGGQNDRTNTVYAYDAGDGGEAWATDIDPAIGSAPVVADGTLYLAGRNADIHALTADDGETLWTWEGTGEQAVDLVPAPAVADDTVYVGSYDNSVYALRSN